MPSATAAPRASAPTVPAAPSQPAQNAPAAVSGNLNPQQQIQYNMGNIDANGNPINHQATAAIPAPAQASAPALGPAFGAAPQQQVTNLAGHNIAQPAAPQMQTRSNSAQWDTPWQGNQGQIGQTGPAMNWGGNLQYSQANSNPQYALPQQQRQMYQSQQQGGWGQQQQYQPQYQQQGGSYQGYQQPQRQINSVGVPMGQASQGGYGGYGGAYGGYQQQNGYGQQQRGYSGDNWGGGQQPSRFTGGYGQQGGQQTQSYQQSYQQPQQQTQQRRAQAPAFGQQQASSTPQFGTRTARMNSTNF